MAYREALCGLLFVCVLGGSNGTVHAADSSEEQLIRRANEFRKAGDDQAALPILEQAYAVSHSPRAAAQLGLCKQALSSWPDAEVYLSESLRADGDPWIKKNRR